MSDTTKTAIVRDENEEVEESLAQELDYDFYGMTVVEIYGREYAIGGDSEADVAAKECIRQSVWSFCPEFLANHMPIDADIIKIIQEAKYEDANEPLTELLRNFNEFVDDAVGADGRGHFVSSYDGEENTLDGIDEDDASEIAKLLDIDEDDWSGTYVYRLN